MKRSWFRLSRREVPRVPRDLQATVEAARLAGAWPGPDLPLEPDSHVPPANAARRGAVGRTAIVGRLAALMLAAILTGCDEAPTMTDHASSHEFVSVHATTDGIVRAPRAEVGEAVAAGEVLVEVDAPQLAPLTDIASAELKRLAILRSVQEHRRAEAQASVERGQASPQLVAYWETEIAQTERGIATYERVLASARNRWTARIAAPMTGCVRERYAEPGEWVREGEVLLRIARTCARILSTEG